MENPTEFFRKSLNEFRAADDLLSKQLKLAEETASAQQIETTKKAKEAERAATGYLRAIEGKKSAPVHFPDIKVSPQIDGGLETLKNVAADVSGIIKKLEQINDQIGSLKDDLEDVLLQEEREQQELERQRREALLKQAADRRKRNIRRAVIATSAVCVAIAWHFWLLNKTTLSFTISVDGKSPTDDRTPNVTLDGKPFVGGGKIGLGRHHLSVELKDFETIQKDFWAFYGANNLGPLSLEFFKGGVSLLSEPPDAEFELSGNGRHWQGKLPMRIEDMPAGIYKLIAHRKGWKFNKELTVIRSGITTNKTEFQYGSIAVTSDPTGLAISTNGVEIGKTPVTLQEVIPGQYTLTASDDENDLTADVSVAPKETATHVFIFHYGTVQLSSTPAGATVVRKGKKVGKTPLPLNHIPAGETMVELQLQDYVPTNFQIQAVEGVTTNLSVKLISEHYLQAMKQAREAFDSAHFAESQKFITAALEPEPNDPAAMELQDKVSQAVAKAEETSRAEKANAKARTLASLTWLDFQKVISDCTDTKQVQNPVQMADGYYDNRGKFHQTGQHTEMQTETIHTYNPITFSQKYQGRTFGFNCPDKWSVS
jgi:hypothetical protein